MRAKIHLGIGLLLLLAPSLLGKELLKLDVQSAYIDGKSHDALFELSAEKIRTIPSYDWAKDDFPPLSFKAAIDRAHVEYYSKLGVNRSDIFKWVSISIASGRPDRRQDIVEANNGKRFHWYVLHVYPYDTVEYTYFDFLPILVLFDGQVLLPRLKKL